MSKCVRQPFKKRLDQNKYWFGVHPPVLSMPGFFGKREFYARNMQRNVEKLGIESTGVRIGKFLLNLLLLHLPLLHLLLLHLLLLHLLHLHLLHLHLLLLNLPLQQNGVQKGRQPLYQ